MSAALQSTMTVEEFLAWENQQDQKYEFDGFAPVAMTGGTAGHSRLLRNLAISVGGRLRGRPCEFHGGELKLLMAHSVRYPDGMVTCSPLTNRATSVSDPVIVFEVLSDSTARVDFHDKNREYAATPSIRRYVILSQDQVLATMFERLGDDWVGHILGPDAVIRMPEIDIEVPLAEFYEGIAFDAPPDAPPSGDLPPG